MSAAPAMAGYLLVAGGVPMAPDAPDPSNPWLNTRAVRGDDYDATYRARERAGQNVHGEADFVESYHPKNVLDAGCGTGRVAIELARRGLAVVGVDLDPRMLGTARKRRPISPGTWAISPRSACSGALMPSSWPGT
jgi:SAM-dependent methyltransferase